MTQHWNSNDWPLQSAPKEVDLFDEHPRNHFDESLNCEFAGLDVPEWSLGVGYIRKTGDLRSFSQEGKVGQNSLPAPGTISNNGLEEQYHVIFEHELGQQAVPQDRMPDSVVPEQDSAKAGNKAADGARNFREIVFDPAANSSISHGREISSARGRTGPMSPNSRIRTKLVKDAGGACWRCKFLGKGCDAGDTCSSCPRKATSWRTLGCIRGTLWDVLPRVVLCPQAGRQSESTPGDHPKSALSSLKEHGARANLINLANNLANIYLSSSQGGCSSSLSSLLSSAAEYQTPADKDPLIDSSLLCLLASLEAIQEQEESQLNTFSHATCTYSACKIDSFNKVNTYLKEYINLLSDVIFKKNARHGKPWWLSVFYSFSIQSYVRRAMIVLVSKLDASQAITASQHLHLAVNLFFVTCNATSKGYDPLSYDFDNLSSFQFSKLSKNYLQAEEGRAAQIAVQKDSWGIDGIGSSYSYLGQLFGMDHTIFVPPASRPPVYGDGSATLAIVDEAICPPPKKRRLNKQSEQLYIRINSTSDQILDTHIIHPGSLELLNSTDELPPPTPDPNDGYKVKENPEIFESDMYTPRWVRGFRKKEEGWCGFCSSWFRLRDEWFNHRCLFHGICAETRKGFAEPKEPIKINPVEQVWKAKCETCEGNVTYRKGDRRHYSGWYMHAANCRIESPFVEISEETEDDMASGW